MAEPNDDSILDTTKKLVGIDPEETGYDTEIITHINSIFITLQQLGVGPKAGFMIEDSEAKWSEFILSDHIRSVKSYMSLKVQLIFDPPETGPAIAAMERVADQMEWRLNIIAEEAKWNEEVLPIF